MRLEVPSPPIVEIEQEEVAAFGRVYQEPGTPLKEFLGAINPIDVDGWSQMRIYSKVFEVFKARIETFVVFNTLIFFFLSFFLFSALLMSFFKLAEALIGFEVEIVIYL